MWLTLPVSGEPLHRLFVLHLLSALRLVSNGHRDEEAEAPHHAVTSSASDDVISVKSLLQTGRRGPAPHQDKSIIISVYCVYQLFVFNKPVFVMLLICLLDLDVC